METMADPNATETRLKSLEESIQKLLRLQDKAAEETLRDEAKTKGAETKNDQSSQENENPGQGEEEKLPLVPGVNCLSWPEWRKLRALEYETEIKKRYASEKVNQKQIVSQRRHVIDIVTDIGDLGPPAYTESRLSSNGSPMFCRMRINSQHIIDILNELTNLFLPQPCQMLHPFKVIIDHLPEIQAHRNVIKDRLRQAELVVNRNIQMTQFVPPGGIESNQEHVSAQYQTQASNKGEESKSKEEKDLEVAQEKFNHYECFIKLLGKELAFEVNVAKAIRDGTVDKIMFCHLWHLFPPGEIIYHQKANPDEPPQATQILKVSGGRVRLAGSNYHSGEWKKSLQRVSQLAIDAFHLDFDGKNFRPFQVKYEIPKYAGEFPITSLPVFPLRYLPERRRATTMSLLLNRGLNFRNLTGVEAAHREYCGRTLDLEPEDIDGRVIIDFKQASIIRILRHELPESNRRDNSEGKGDEADEGRRVFGLRPLTQSPNAEVLEVMGRYDEPDMTIYNDHNYDADRTDRLFSLRKILLTPSQELSATDLGDDHLRLLPGTVYAYILRSRRYCRCDISFMKEIRPNKRAFDDLVLPTKYKTMLRSLVDSHSLGSRPVEQKTEGDDETLVENLDLQSSQASHDIDDTLSIVKGKGKGLIILLHGAPGVGKTSTAETIAETTGRPLLPVTCGDIGESARDVEKNLEQIFTNSHRWGCVLLLDEAEVFLTKRSLQDLTRNAMVSVFLRVLEFYSGILFLTTNRVGIMDEAFKSRIHISLYYPPHDWKTSKEIWRVNLRRCGENVQVDDHEILRFAKKHFHRADENSRWNGRQIYNAFKTAIALAEYEKSKGDGRKSQLAVLTESHFRQVAQVAKKFDEYLLETHGGESMAATNQQNQVRADRFGLNDDGSLSGPKRRLTKHWKLDLNDIPSTSEEDSESDSSPSSSGSEDDSSSSEDDVKRPRRRGESSRKKNDETKKKKKSQSSKSKKSSRRHVEDDSD